MKKKKLPVDASEITKLEDKLDPEKVSSLRSMDLKALDHELNVAAKTKEGYITLKREDSELNDAKALAKELARPHNDDIKAAGTLQRFIALLILERGTPVKEGE